MLISAQEMSIFVSCLGRWLFMQMGSSNQSSIGGQCFLWWIVVVCLHSNQCMMCLWYPVHVCVGLYISLTTALLCIPPVAIVLKEIQEWYRNSPKNSRIFFLT